jgi:hypothetical protein
MKSQNRPEAAILSGRIPYIFTGEYKANCATFRFMSLRSCRVTLRDTEGIEHTAEVTAESLYEAVALGLRAIRQCSWVEDIGQNFSIRVLARDTPVEHTVEFRAFHKWLEQRGRSPREVTARARVREILGASGKI